jgi:2-amino-4-hydroxy-6-hydroxymethyldihydropteridine diphosphokinase
MHDGIKVITVSPLYRSKPIDAPGSQPDYLNCVLAVETDINPETLLGVLQELESRYGRVRGVQKNLARTLDLDLLLMGNQSIDTLQLVLPHPRIARRAFVLLPLNDIAPGLMIPGNGRVEDLLDNVRDQEIIRL